MHYNPQTLKQNTSAILVASAGAGMAILIGFPAPWLTGSAIAVTCASIMGMRADIHPWLRNMAFVLIGIAMGSTITPEVFAAAATWWASFALLAGSLVIMLWLCPLLLIRYWQFDRTTAFLSSSPGHLSFILGLSANSGANLPAVSVIQSIRVLMLTLVIPLIVTLLGYEPASLPGVEHAMPVQQFMGTLSVAIVLSWIASRYSLPTAYLLCGMFVAGVSQVTGIASGGLHPIVSMLAIIVMGAILGTRFSGVAVSDLLRALSAGLFVTTVVLLITAVAALLFSHLSGLPVAQLLIAFAPGGVEAMAALALMLDADPAFVAAHHAWRLVVLSVIVPIWMIAHSLRAPSD